MDYLKFTKDTIVYHLASAGSHGRVAFWSDGGRKVYCYELGKRHAYRLNFYPGLKVVTPKKFKVGPRFKLKGKRAEIVEI